MCGMFCLVLTWSGNSRHKGECTMALETVGVLNQPSPSTREERERAEADRASRAQQATVTIVSLKPLQIEGALRTFYHQLSAYHRLFAPAPEEGLYIARMAPESTAPSQKLFAVAGEIVLLLAHQYIALEEGLTRANQRLDELLARPEGWYFHGARHISPDAAKRARAILSSLRTMPYGALSKRVEPYAIVPAVTGGIQIEWRGDRGSLEIEVGSHGPFAYLLEPQQEREEEGEAVSEQEVLALLRRIL
jgi:hypothetical protein